MHFQSFTRYFFRHPDLPHSTPSDIEWVLDSIRPFLTATDPDSLSDPTPLFNYANKSVMQQPSNDTSRFQTIDFVIAPRPWFPSVHQAKSIPSLYVPSDHFLVEAHFCIKLGSKLSKTGPPVKLDFSMSGLNDDQKLQVIY